MATYTLTDGTRKTQLTISGDTTVVFPTKLDYFGVRSLDGANILVSKIKAPTILEDGVYSTDEGDGDVVVDDGVFTDTLYLKGSGTVVVYGGAKPNHLPFKVGGKGGGGSSGGCNYKGTTTTAIENGSTTNPITIDGEEYTAVFGDIVVYGYTEFVFDGTAWSEFGRPFDTTPTSGSANAVTSDGVYKSTPFKRGIGNALGSATGTMGDSSVSGALSISFGSRCSATSTATVALNSGTLANQSAMTAVGTYNQPSAGDLFNIGNGRSLNDRSNIVEVNSTSMNVNGDIKRDGVGIDDYTTTERKIGKWIDGSDLYQRTFEVTSTIHNDSQYYDNVLGTSDSGINIVDFEGFVEFTGTDIVQRFSLHQPFGGSDYMLFFVNNSDLTSHIKFATNLALSRAVITIKYTKPLVQANVLNANTQQTEEPTDEMR